MESDQLTLFVEDSPVKTYPLVAAKKELAKKQGQVCGQNAPVYLGKFDQNLQSLKTSQHSLVETAGDGFSEFSGTFPRSGMMRSGTVYQLPNLARTTKEIEFGLWPTPTAMTGGESVAPSHIDGSHGWNLGAAARDSLSDKPHRMWPTPSTRDYKGGYLGGRIRNGKISWDTLDVAVQHTDNKQKVSGTLNPTWVEWLMGFPLGHTDLNA